ncbi:dispersed gene family protein 1 (DGF-1), putative, partial [Trypanosoma cruzi marinkellei]
GSTLVTTSSYAIHFPRFTFGENTTLLLLDNYIEGNIYAVYFPVAVAVDGGGIIVKGNTLRVTGLFDGVESAVCAHAVDIRNGGYIDVENNTMSAVQGVILYGDTTVSSAGLLRVADCIFFESTGEFESALVCLYGSVSLLSGAQWRVEGNNVSAFSVLIIANARHKIQLSGSGTTVVLAHNRQADDSFFFAYPDQSNLIVVSPARFVVGCNLQGEKEVSYNRVLRERVVVFECGTCNDDAACYVPGTESVDRGSCSCSCKDGWRGASCLP